MCVVYPSKVLGPKINKTAGTSNKFALTATALNKDAKNLRADRDFKWPFSHVVAISHCN